MSRNANGVCIYGIGSEIWIYSGKVKEPAKAEFRCICIREAEACHKSGISCMSPSIEFYCELVDEQVFEHIILILF
jgi:hypothetical protein